MTFWACAVLGAVVVPLNAWWKAEELEFGLERLRGQGADRRRAPPRDRSPTGWRRIPSVEHVFVIDDAGATAPVRPFAELIADAGDPATCREAPLDEDDLLAILYTSGTTGQPKGATLTHRQVIANLSEHHRARRRRRRCAARRRPRREAGLQSASLLVVPLFHVTGCLSTMTVELRDRRQGRADAARPLRSRRRDGRSSSASR